MSKTNRQHLIMKLLSEHSVTSQQQLADLLAGQGVITNRATVSRDLDELGAVTVRIAGGNTAYAIPEHPVARIAPEEHLRRVLSEWVADIGASGNLAVVRTPPGSAHVVASALDRAGLEKILGTVAGDDSLIVVASEGISGAELADCLRDLVGLTGPDAQEGRK